MTTWREKLREKKEKWTETFWKRHSNPWSGATRILIAPFLVASIWYHNWYALAAVVAWTVLNPIIFPEPKSTDNWASKCVLGEQLWVNSFKWDRSYAPDILLNAIAGVLFVICIYAAYMSYLWLTIISGTVAFISEMWFVHRMSIYYESNKDK
jgi:hypothetical protein